MELRIKVGHWEGDLVVGKNATGYLVTLMERVTRFALVGWSPSKEADAVAFVIVDLFMKAGIPIDGITFDNGKEADAVAFVIVDLFMKAGIPIDGITFDNGKEFAATS